MKNYVPDRELNPPCKRYSPANGKKIVHLFHNGNDISITIMAHGKYEAWAKLKILCESNWDQFELKN